VGLVSDTHGWLDPALFEHFRGASLVIHAGDVGRPEVLQALRQVAPVLAVRGNIDGGELADLPITAVADVGGRRLAVIHAAGSPARPTKAARELVASAHPDVLVVGHSHIPVAGRAAGLTWINPGAAGREGFHQERTAGLLWIGPGGELRHFRVHLGPRAGTRS
jgi:putative phosphoesterase